MNTQNVSFQSLRLLCSKAKTRLLLSAFLLCLVGSARADFLPQGVIRFKGTLVAAENYRDYVRSPIPAIPGPIGPPVTPSVVFFVTAEGSANTTELGQFTVIYASMVDYLSGASPQCARFINADGDSIYTSTMGQTSATNDPAVASVIELHTVTGGTGQFTGVSGSFTVYRSIKFAADALSGNSQGSFNGLIRVITRPPPTMPAPDGNRVR